MYTGVMVSACCLTTIRLIAYSRIIRSGGRHDLSAAPGTRRDPLVMSTSFTNVLMVGDKYQNTGVAALHHITVVSCFGTYPLPRV